MTHHDSFMDSKKTTLIRTHPTLNPIHKVTFATLLKRMWLSQWHHTYTVV